MYIKLNDVEVKKVIDIIILNFKENEGKINKETAEESLRLLSIDAHGLDEIDRRLLKTLI